MSTTTTEGRWLVVPEPGIDLGALTRALASEAAERFAEAVTLTIDWLEDDGTPLGEKQKMMLLQNVLTCFDGFEAFCRSQLEQDAEIVAAVADVKAKGGSFEDLARRLDPTKGDDDAA